MCACLSLSLFDVFVFVRLSLSMCPLFVCANFCLFIFPSTYISMYFFLLCLSVCLSVCVGICLSVLPSTQANPIQSSLTNCGVLCTRSYVPLSMTLQADVS